MQSDTAIAQRRGMIGVEQQGVVVACHGFLVAAEVFQRVALVEQGAGVSGRDRQRRLVARQRFFMAAEGAQQDGAIVVRFGEAGIERDGAVEARQRLFRPRQRVEHQAVVQEQERRRRTGAHGIRHQLQRFGRPAGGEADKPKEMQGVGMVGLGRQNGGIEPFRLGQFALLMQFDGLRQRGRQIQRLGFRLVGK